MPAACSFPNSMGTPQSRNTPDWLGRGVDEAGVGGGLAGGGNCYCCVWILGTKWELYVGPMAYTLCFLLVIWFRISSALTRAVSYTWGLVELIRSG